MWNLVISRRSRKVTAKKCAKECASRAELLFYIKFSYRPFTACHSRGTKPPCWDAKVALGQDQPIGYIIFLCLVPVRSTNKISLILMLIFAMCSADFTDDPVSVTWIAFNGKLMRFRITIFKKQFVCLLFSVCSFITLVENMIAASNSLILLNLRFILLIQCLITRITSAKMSGNFKQFILSSSASSEFFLLKICVTFYCR